MSKTPPQFECALYAERFICKRPSCRVYYVTTGSSADDKNLVARRDAVLSDIRGTEMFDEKETELICYGAHEVHSLYQARKTAGGTNLLVRK